MEYVLSSTQIDKILKPFWDQEFEGAKVRNIDLSGEKWTGVVKVDDELGLTLLIGRPVDRRDMKWFSNGHYFTNKWDLFGMTPKDFNESMARYVNDNFGLDVTDVL